MSTATARQKSKRKPQAEQTPVPAAPELPPLPEIVPPDPELHHEMRHAIHEYNKQISDAPTAYARAEKTKKRFPDGEPVILRNAGYACKYAINILNSRWPIAEATISKDAAASFSYAKAFFKGAGWIPGEQAILSNGSWSVAYARDVLGRRWPEAEAVISDNAAAAVEYAKDVIKGRWPEAEPCIFKHAEPSFEYAQCILKHRLTTDVEHVIAKDAETALRYAKYFLDGRRWPEAEPAIAKDPSSAAEYAVSIVKGRWPMGEKAISESGSWNQKRYIEVVSGRKNDY